MTFLLTYARFKAPHAIINIYTILSCVIVWVTHETLSIAFIQKHRIKTHSSTNDAYFFLRNAFIGGPKRD
jgi:hypothetical protein